MPPKEVKKIADKLTDSEKKKIKQENKAKANPELAAGKKEKSDAKRERRKVTLPKLRRSRRPHRTSPPFLTVILARRSHVRPSSRHAGVWQLQDLLLSSGLTMPQPSQSQSDRSQAHARVPCVAHVNANRHGPGSLSGKS